MHPLMAALSPWPRAYHEKIAAMGSSVLAWDTKVNSVVSKVLGR